MTTGARQRYRPCTHASVYCFRRFAAHAKDCLGRLRPGDYRGHRLVGCRSKAPISRHQTRRSRRHLFRRRRCRSVSLARRRECARNAQVGRGAEQGHVRLSGQDSLSGSRSRRGSKSSSTIRDTARPSATANTSSSPRTTVFRIRASTTCRRAWMARRKFCSIQTSSPRTERPSWPRSHFRRTASISPMASQRADRTGTRST